MFWGKTIYGDYGKGKSKRERRVSNWWDDIRKRRGYCKCVIVRTRGDVERIKKSAISACTTWMAPNKCHERFFVHWSGQVPYSIITSKQNVVVSFYNNTSWAIVFFCAIFMQLEFTQLYLSTCRPPNLRG